jgi:hypothetical protein
LLRDIEKEFEDLDEIMREVDSMVGSQDVNDGCGGGRTEYAPGD